MKYIIGIGNYSMFDDSIGIKVIEYIEENNLIANLIAKEHQDSIQAIDLSGNLLNLFNYLNSSTEKIVIIDTAKINIDKQMPDKQQEQRVPGEFIVFTPEEVESTKNLANISTHEGDLLKVLALARETDYFIPEIVIIGVIPKEIKNDFGLSLELNNKLPVYAKKALEEIL
ncbi:MAG: hydrogenase maturation protease [Oligoflexia bacterium]|nr:hydrogenase maturation protease [Oligoflexia bacterium]